MTRDTTELGARSDTEPSATPTIEPYFVKAPSHGIGDCSFQVKAVVPERTFWEKAMLLHEESYRADAPKARLSRHYYDLWCLLGGGVAERAIADPDLARRVAEHRRIFFRKNKTTHDSMRPGSLRLVPAREALSDWKRDYEAMRETMFFGEPPTFGEVIGVVKEIEDRINRPAAAN